MEITAQKPGRRARLVRATAVAAVIALSMFALPGRASATPARDTSVSVQLINDTRGAKGIARLTPDALLQNIASRHAGAMAASGRIHHSSDIRSQLPRGWWAWGENVAYGPSVGWIHGALMRSPSHAVNVLNRSYNRVGVGVAYGRNGTVYVAQVYGGW